MKNTELKYLALKYVQLKIRATQAALRFRTITHSFKIIKQTVINYNEAENAYCIILH